MDITLNIPSRLFVVRAAHGYSTLGFDYVAKQLRQLVQRIPVLAALKDAVAETTVGSLEQYNLYRSAIDTLARQRVQTDTWYDEETPQAVVRILERARKNGSVLRIFLGDRSTGRDWMEEHDTIGRIGRSTGTIRVPLLVAEGESGGGALLDACIVRVASSDGRDLWRHPAYHLPELRISPDVSDGRWWVTSDGTRHAGFKRYEQAAAWIGFISGTHANEVAA
jgi:hypothetical protein